MEFRSRPEDTWGSEYDWADFCAWDEEIVYDLSASDLNDEVQSYKCGRNTAIRFCKNADGLHCDQYYESESGAGGSESQDLGLHDAHTTIRLTPYDPAVRHAATVYSMTMCHGHQSVIWLDEGEECTGDKYTNLHDSIDLPNWSLQYDSAHTECEADPPGIHSVLFP